MLQLLEKRIRIMTICARVELAAFLVGMVSLGCFLTGFFAEGIWIPFSIVSLVCIGIIAGCTLYPKQLRKNTDLSPYAVPIRTPDYESVCTMLTGSPIAEDAFVSFRKRNGCSVRLLIQNCMDFDQKALSSRRRTLNRMINQKYSVRQDGPSDVVRKQMRINLVVCRHSCDAARVWVSRSPEQLLSRSEAIVNAVICLEEQVLLFPACLDSLDLGEVVKYQAAAELLVGNLTADVEK